MEDRVDEIGKGLVKQDALAAFICHEPNSSEYQDGRDFTAVMEIDGERIERSFGITISEGSSSIMDQRLHPDYPQWSFPWNMRDETIKEKILGLF